MLLEVMSDMVAAGELHQIVLAAVCSVFILAESRRIGVGLPVALGFVLAGFLLAMACAFPLFLLYRERRLATGLQQASASVEA